MAKKTSKKITPDKSSKEAMAKKINKGDIGKLLGQWSQEFAVFVPSKEGDTTKMVGWGGEDAEFLEWYRNTVMPPKASFLPMLEEMFRFQKDKGSYKLDPTTLDDQEKLIFAIRPCDANALAILDMTFRDAYEDPYYLSRRRNALLVGLGCTNPYDSCFCTSMGSNPFDSTNVDIMLTDIGDEFLIEGMTEPGKELVGKTDGLAEVTTANVVKSEEVKKASSSKVTREVNTRDIKERLASSFEDEDYWKNVAEKCISCGVCTLLCPTCYCFDINDEMFKQQGARLRSWDSCAFPIYTKMPVENPREEKWQRVRQKVCHKYEFYPMNFDVIACTGCGRCIRLCPVNWDIAQTINSVAAKTS